MGFVKKLLFLIVALILGISFSHIGCGGGMGGLYDNGGAGYYYASEEEPEDNYVGELLGYESYGADVERETAPDATEAELDELIDGNNEFAFDLYMAIHRQNGNIFMSPYSIYSGFAMQYAGARGETESEIASTMHYTLEQDRLHNAFNALDIKLDGFKEIAYTGYDFDTKEYVTYYYGYTLEISNSLWGQTGYPFLSDFINTIGENYEAGLNSVDFQNSPEDACYTINNRVKEQTNGIIENLLSPAQIDVLTKLVLVNSIYFKASWDDTFLPEMTQKKNFYFLDGRTVQTDMMYQESHFLYIDGSGFKAIELFYERRLLSMIVLVPDKGNFTGFETSMDETVIQNIISELHLEEDDSYTNAKYVQLIMPKFEFSSEVDLKDALQDMGMTGSFGGSADFSGIDGSRELYIGAAKHKSYVKIDEEGTEAAAATYIGDVAFGVPEVDAVLTIDRPFIFLIRDNSTGLILFLGRFFGPA